MSIKKFELGKCYRHTTGSEMKIVGLASSTKLTEEDFNTLLRKRK